MYLIAGLGNFGTKYQKTKHNFGFLALDQIISDYKFQNLGNKFSSEVFSLTTSNNQKIIALKPQTYMNNSGLAILQAIQFYKILPQNILVLHDEIDLPLGSFKIKIGGGNAGHNGLKSIDQSIGTNYWRVRLGVGRPLNKEFEIADYVLSNFSEEEMKIVDDINKKISQDFPNILTKYLINQNI